MRAQSIDKFRIICLMIAVAIIFIALIGINAYSAKLQFEINTLNKQIQEHQRNIQNLEVKIKSASNINNLEQKALDLGLVYPDFDAIKYLEKTEPIEEFALVLKEAIY